MLKALSICNIAVIKELSVDFSDGFTVLTGETGAGKSVLIESIAFALGSRATKGMIRTGERLAEVSAVFDVGRATAEKLTDAGYAPHENGELTLYRYIDADGKSGAKINGRASSLSALKSVAKYLVAIHGQQDSGALSEKPELLAMLDGYIGHDDAIADYAASYGEYVSVKTRLSSLRESLKDRAMMIDILEYQNKELESAKLRDPDEEEKLIKLRNKYRSFEKVAKNVALISRALIDNEKGVTASYMLDRAALAVRQLSDVMPEAEDYASRLDAMRYELSDIADAASRLIDDDCDDPEQKLDAVEKRLSLIKKLRGKYGDTIEEIIAKHAEIKSRLHDLKNSDDALGDLENALSAISAVCAAKAEKLSASRKKHALELTSKICDVLAVLDMPKVVFKIDVTPRFSNGEYDFDAKGYDDVDFLVSANVGEEIQPISKIASGGELSRIMLAIKSALQSKCGEETSIFDEIDAGVSGGTSERIGRKLYSMSKYSQIICITHSAQIASLADVHLKISKSEKSGRVESAVCALDRPGRVDELSRIIGGINITEKQLVTAEEMLEKAEMTK